MAGTTGITDTGQINHFLGLILTGLVFLLEKMNIITTFGVVNNDLSW